MLTQWQFDVWIEALRSGVYKQGKGNLYDPDNKTYCCLGVLCVVNDFPVLKEGKVVDGVNNTPRGLGDLLDFYQRNRLANINDHGSNSFEYIAGYLMRNKNLYVDDRQATSEHSPEYLEAVKRIMSDTKE